MLVTKINRVNTACCLLLAAGCWLLVASRQMGPILWYVSAFCRNRNQSQLVASRRNPSQSVASQRNCARTKAKPADNLCKQANARAISSLADAQKVNAAAGSCKRTRAQEIKMTYSSSSSEPLGRDRNSSSSFFRLRVLADILGCIRERALACLSCGFWGMARRLGM